MIAIGYSLGADRKHVLAEVFLLLRLSCTIALVGIGPGKHAFITGRLASDFYPPADSVFILL
ncbi:MAG: hypothetical protein WAN92_06565 [Herbaspirillum sp.]